MADKEYNVNISVTDTGARQTGKRVEGIGRKAKKSASGVNLLKSALGALGISFSVNELIKFSDTWTKINSRLRLVTKSTADFLKIQKKLFNISTKTRTDIDDNIKLYQRLALAQENLDATSGQMLLVTETVGKSLAILGVSSTEARGALLQLGQAFSNPVLQAQEFNSILDGIPIIAQAAAKSLGLTVGEFRQAVNTQKISGKTFFNSILAQSDVIDKQFQQVNQTIGQSFTLIKNELVKFIGATGESSGVVAAFVDSLTLLAIHIDKVVVGVAIFGFLAALAVLKSVIVALAGATGITLLIKGLWSLTKVILAASVANLTWAGTFATVKAGILLASGALLILLKGLGAFLLIAAKVLGAVALLAVAFASGFAIGESISDPIVAGLEIGLASLKGFSKSWNAIFKFIARKTSFKQLGVEILTIGTITKVTIDGIRKDLKKDLGDTTILGRTGDSVRSQLDFLKKSWKKAGEAFSGSFGNIDSDSGIKEFEKLSKGASKVNKDIANEFKDLNIHIVKALGAKLLSDKINPENLFKDGFSFLVDSAEDAGKGIQNFLSQKLKEVRDEMRSGLSPEMQKIIDDAKKLTAAWAEAFKPQTVKEYKDEIKELLKHLRPADMREYGKEVDKVFAKIANMSTDNSRKELAKLKEKLLELPQVFGAIDAAFKGVEAGFNSWADEATDIFDGMEKLTKSALDKMTDSIVEFTETGKFNFRQFVADVNKELLKISIKGVLGSGINLLKDNLTNVASQGTSKISGAFGSNPLGGPLSGDALTSKGLSEEAVTVTNPSSDVLANQQVIQGQEQMGFLSQIGSGVSSLFTSFTGIFSKIFTVMGDTAATAISQLSALFGISTSQASGTLSITTLLSSLITVNTSGFAAIAAAGAAGSIGGAFGGGGGFGSNPLGGPLSGLQMGGTFTGNDAFMAGERGPELIIPNGQGRVLNNSDTEDALGGGEGNGPNIFNILDPDIGSQYLKSANGERDVINIISTNREQFKAMLT
jgi:tape measure domain-containing protein